jgi:hypothetical protein
MIDLEPKTSEQLAKDHIVRQTLEWAAREVEGIQTNSASYIQALKKAAQRIRAMKP